MKAPFCSKALEAKACLCIRTAASLPAGAQDLPARSSLLPGDGAGRGSASSATKGRDSLPARGCPQGHPQPPDPPLPPRTHTGHPSVLREERSGAERRAGLAARPPGPGSAASSGAGRGGMRRAGPPGRGPAERVTNKANGDWSGGGPAPRAAARGGRERGGKPSTAWPAMEARGCFCPRSSPESWAPVRSARASQR